MKEIDHWSVESASTAPSGLVKQGVLGKLIFPFHYLFALGENVALRTVLFLRRRLSPMRRRATQVPATNSRYSTALSRVDAILTLVGLFLPARIMKEDAGDARRPSRSRTRRRPTAPTTAGTASGSRRSRTSTAIPHTT